MLSERESMCQSLRLFVKSERKHGNYRVGIVGGSCLVCDNMPLLVPEKIRRASSGDHEHYGQPIDSSGLASLLL